MKFILVLTLLTISISPAFSQKGKPGFIVTLGNDTISGFIQDGTDAELASGITFTQLNSTHEDKYLPTSLTSFGFVNGRSFKQFSISQNEKDSTFVFAKKVLEGKINLYTFSTKKDKTDIFLTNNSTQRTVYVKAPQRVMVTDQYGVKGYVEPSQHMELLKIAKDDKFINSLPADKFKYNENKIRKDIKKYNDRFKNDFPVSEYKPQFNYRYDVSGGFQIVDARNEIDAAFRVAAYRLKNFPEKSRSFSFIRGVSYRYAATNDPGHTEKEQAISLIPFGIHVQSDSKVIKPYFYVGAGITALHTVATDEDSGKNTELHILPTLNVGAGLKIKTGSDFIIAEITPSLGRGFFLNFGYSF